MDSAIIGLTDAAQNISTAVQQSNQDITDREFAVFKDGEKEDVNIDSNGEDRNADEHNDEQNDEDEEEFDEDDEEDDEEEETDVSIGKIVSFFSSCCINLVLPFINGIMLGFGEILAHEIGFRYNWLGARVVPARRMVQRQQQQQLAIQGQSNSQYASNNRQSSSTEKSILF
ncbi:unnamed protein product [[Candida] boidinii]|uniref:Unnamed protein product n=1 Tax=Candida boidinii TaxID=5477 RepID=A0A9W6T3I6_CANBO|nr:hypothetical protein BVG19_g3801 [[Candida] boidinii]OWB50520.1 hypothetical protein B5S27_g2070 [[Candida] boidinii]OWB66032.1 hypothetical protein B5S30_g1366 [[Candida] boidinii]GME73855.1 unnamed protein product [[Candida] boidinii]